LVVSGKRQSEAGDDFGEMQADEGDLHRRRMRRSPARFKPSAVSWAAEFSLPAVPQSPLYSRPAIIAREAKQPLRDRCSPDRATLVKTWIASLGSQR
jgi:hypothetical protein